MPHYCSRTCFRYLKLVEMYLLNLKQLHLKKCVGALASTVIELEDSNSKLAILKAQGDGSKGAPIIFPILGNKLAGGDVARDTLKEIHDMESLHKDLQVMIYDV